MSETPGVDTTKKVRILHTAEGQEIGHIRYEGVIIPDVAPGATGEVRVSWPYAVSITSGMIRGAYDVANSSEAAELGDEICAFVDIRGAGLVLSNIVNGDSEIIVNEELAAFVDPGDFIAFGHENDAKEYQIVSKTLIPDPDGDGPATGILYLDLESPMDASVDPMTWIQVHRYFVGRADAYYPLAPKVAREWGRDTTDSSPLPPYVEIVMRFHNAGETATKTAIGDLGLLYGDE